MWKFVVVLLLPVAAVGALSSAPATAAPQASVDRVSALDARVESYSVTPDGRTLVYSATSGDGSDVGLFSVPVSGGPVMQLTQDSGCCGDVKPGFVVSPDSLRVAYRAEDGSGVAGLFSVGVGGGPVVRLSGDLGCCGDVEADVVISADSSIVVYRADQDVNGLVELYSVGIGGGTVTKLNDSIPPKTNSTYIDGVRKFAVSADSNTVVYTADEDSSGRAELYSVPIGGGSGVKLNGPLPTLAKVSVEGVKISSDSKTVVYRAPATSARQSELFSVPIGGGAQVRLSAVLPACSNFFLCARVNEARITPDGLRVVYRADQEGDGMIELFSVPIGGGPGVRLNSALIPDGDVHAFGIAPDSTTVVYVADQNVNEAMELFAASVSGGGRVQLSGQLPNGGDVKEFAITSDSSRVVYRADETKDGRFELRSAAIHGSGSIVLNGQLVRGGDVKPGISTTPDSRLAVYLADQTVNNQISLFVADVGIRCRGLLANIVGTPQDDTIVGTAGADVIHGLGGDDNIRGGSGADVICGGSGSDRIRGGRGADRISGGSGGDVLSGNRGRDTINGNRGRDRIDGGRGADNCRGGPQRDILRSC